MKAKICDNCEKNKILHKYQDKTLGIFKRWFNCGLVYCTCTVCGNKIKKS